MKKTARNHIASYITLELYQDLAANVGSPRKMQSACAGLPAHAPRTATVGGSYIMPSVFGNQVDRIGM